MLLDPNRPIRTRLLSLVGLLVTAALIYLGIWPSIFTVAAFLVIPGAVVFGALIFCTSIVAKSPRWRIYLVLCVALSVICWAWELIGLTLDPAHRWP